MKALSVVLLACLGPAWAQSAPPPMPAPSALPDLPDTAVVATFEDGVKFTMGDFKKIMAILEPQQQQAAMRDRRMFLQQWALLRKLAKMAETEKLDQASPTREMLDYQRIQILFQAKINDALSTATVEPAEVVKHYDVNKEKYKQVRVKAIYISFTSGDAANASSKKLLTEEQAREKAARLLADIRGGADFVKAVKENSDDETSRDKNGDFATLRPSDNIPDAIRSAVFSLKPGDVSEPVRQPNGFYLLRAEEVTYRPLSQVRDEVFSELKQEHYRQWLDKMNRETKVEYDNPAFLGLTPGVVGMGK